MQNKENVRLLLPAALGPEFLREEWCGEIPQEESRVLIFWDTFEWGLWFGGYLLYSCGGSYHLCLRDGGWMGEELCREKGGGARRFWGEFRTPAMRTQLQGVLGVRGLAPVVEGTFHRLQDELRNELGKIVCRLEWDSISAGKRGGEELLHTCRLHPLLGYEAEAARVMARLTLAGARTTGDGPLELLLRNSGCTPRRYTLRPPFGLKEGTPAREAVGRIVRTILGIAASNLPGLLSDLDTEFLHDYRICFRKIRSVLALVKGVYPPEEIGRMRTILGDLARQTNRLRDLDVYLLAREEYLALLPPGLRPALEGMFRDFAVEREGEVRAVISRLRTPSCTALLRELEEYFGEEMLHGFAPAADLPVGGVAFRRIHGRYKKIRKLAGGIGADTPDEEVHQLRIQCKKLRYLLEFFSELIPPEEGGAMQKLLRRLQGRLGDFNDASVQQLSLLTYWQEKGAGSDVALGVGGLVSILYQRQQSARALIRQALDEFCGDATAALFKQCFKTAVSAPPTAPPRSSTP